MCRPGHTKLLTGAYSVEHFGEIKYQVHCIYIYFKEQCHVFVSSVELIGPWEKDLKEIFQMIFVIDGRGISCELASVDCHWTCL